jgi:polysaccharide biosynthesis protein PslG
MFPSAMPRPTSLIAAALAVAALGASTAEAKPVDAGFFGISVAHVFQALDPPQRERHVAGIAKLGVGTVRVALSWDEVEPRPPRQYDHEYHWDGPDERAALLARHGLRMYPAIAYSASWARQPGTTALGPPQPEQFQGYAEFAAAAATRYGPGGSFWVEHPELPYLPVDSWEIWNEPNLAYFWGGKEPDPSQYAHLLSGALDAIRAVQRGANVVLGGLSGSVNPQRYLRKVLGEVPSLRRRLDHVGLHPYGGSAGAAFKRLAGFREALDEYGREAIRIEISEDGMTTRRDADRERYLSRMASTVADSGCRVSRYIVHTWVTDETVKNDPEHWYGIAGRDAKLKASGRAYRRAIADVRDSGKGELKPAQRIC